MVDGEGRKAEDVVAAASDGKTAVLEAWLRPGPGRALHYAAKRALFASWPTLALAIERLIEENYPQQ